MALKVSLGLRGRHSKGKGKGIRARDHVPHALSRAQIPPSPFNTCHAGQVSLVSSSQTERLRLQKKLKRLEVFKEDSDVNESWREKR